MQARLLLLHATCLCAPLPPFALILCALPVWRNFVCGTGNTLHATKEVSTMTATLDLQLEAKQVQKRSMSGQPGMKLGAYITLLPGTMPHSAVWHLRY